MIIAALFAALISQLMHLFCEAQNWSTEEKQQQQSPKIAKVNLYTLLLASSPIDHRNVREIPAARSRNTRWVRTLKLEHTSLQKLMAV